MFKKINGLLVRLVRQFSLINKVMGFSRVGEGAKILCLYKLNTRLAKSYHNT